MKTGYWVICLCIYSFSLSAQTVKDRLAKAVDLLQADPQMKHALLGLQVVQAQTGDKIFEVNAQTGLAPASCQKIITSIAALELLGPAYRYETQLGYTGKVSGNTLHGDLYLLGSGDPSLGSWRFDATKEDRQMQELTAMLTQKGIRKITGNLVGYSGSWEQETLPGGWIWDDIGNYYGAGTSALNWHENQYDLILRSGKDIGDTVAIIETRPALNGANLQSQLLAAAKGTGDNAYIYLPPFAGQGFVRGTIPVEEKAFVISGSFPDPALQTTHTLKQSMELAGIRLRNLIVSYDKVVPQVQNLGKLLSPRLDSLNFWFMRKSINLYGEAFLKTIAFEKTGRGGTDKGVNLVKQFWKEQGIGSAALQVIDGSGLSPQNRITADALVQALQYARSRNWFPVFYESLPVFNQMKLKSGTIGGTKSFAGYHTSREGVTYTVAIIINNYDGSAGEIVKKMFRVLDELK
jgi:D-alanyl-D-alanine carboxypeptidase/D-alanyl-D-alanine-endopeptidase (penicillin-binding protein 4)